ncbi:YbfB/YjiJ family MFS transporter, partial [bacterium]|nr:YbfB/YjiJ family MFS transporter [bacterium]
MAAILIGGLLALALAMGVGRFAYTAILPAMQSEAGLSVTASGWLASINYLGYFVGAVAMAWVPRGRARTFAFRASLIASAVTTLAMGVLPPFAPWAILRLLSGLASAGVFVLGVAMTLDALARAGRERWAGWLYTGIGGGIAGSGLFVALTRPGADGSGLDFQTQWVILGLTAGVFALLPWFKVRDDHAPLPTSAPTVAPGGGAPAAWTPLLLLTAAYFLEGGGYIVTGTFLPAMMAADPITQPWAGWAWMLAGVAAVPSGILWAAVGRRIGLWGALIAAHLLQAGGVVLPLAGGAAAGVVSAMLFGATFVGIVSLSFALGRRLSGGASTKIIGLLTAAYGLGQILGPTAAAYLAGAAGRYDAAVIAAAAAVATAAALLVAGAAA